MSRPEQPDDNDLIVIASGKCSNAREFETFAARLNEQTMLYERDEGFDFDAWKQSLEPRRHESPKPTPRNGAQVIAIGGKCAEVGNRRRYQGKRHW